MSVNPFIDSFSLVLASQSPRRRELLSSAGFPFTVRAANIPEAPAAGEAPDGYVARLARQKAEAITAAGGEGILAADTTVVLKEADTLHILEKPQGADDARRMLLLLSGRTHQVHTAVHLRWGGQSWSAVETSEVSFATLCAGEIDSYIASGEPFDKAGAYGIQGIASRFVTGIRGCYFNIVGLPVHRVYALFQQAGVLARDESRETVASATLRIPEAPAS